MNYKKFAMFALILAVAGSAMAEGDTSAVTTLITSVQTTITTVIAAVLVAGAVVLTALVGLRALPWAYRKITAFFK